MQGTIVKIVASEGQRVSAGETIVVLEAMKMEHTLSAPADAVVDAVEVAAGDQVGEGAVILRFAVEKTAA